MNQFIDDGLKQLKTAEINTAGSLLMSPLPGQFWADVKYFVKLQHDASPNLSGAQKHEAVKAQLKIIFQKDLGPILILFGETFIDVAIKIGVLYLVASNPAAGAIVAPIAPLAEHAIENDLANRGRRLSDKST